MLCGGHAAVGEGVRAIDRTAVYVAHHGAASIGSFLRPDVLGIAAYVSGAWTVVYLGDPDED